MREYTTEIAVASGETVVMGGIEMEGKEVTVRKFPVLGSAFRYVPILNWIFRNRNSSDTSTELVVFITPAVVSADADAQEIREDYEQKLEKATSGVDAEQEQPSADQAKPSDGNDKPGPQGSVKPETLQTPAPVENLSMQDETDANEAATQAALMAAMPPSFLR